MVHVSSVYNDNRVLLIKNSERTDTTLMNCVVVIF